MDISKHGICGWELNNLDPELFETQILEVSGACKHCEHLHRCSVPSESVRCLVPREGELFGLGQESPEEGLNLSYFAWVNGDAVRFIQLSEPHHYWAKARWVEKGDIPPLGLAQLEERLNVMRSF
jgi:hypothetical protein